MGIIYFLAVLYAVVFVLTYHSAVKPALRAPNLKKKQSIAPVIFIFAIGFVVRLIIAGTFEGHSTDMTCFKAWSNWAFNDGLSNFYFTDRFADYPPGYMYVLWLIGAVQKLFDISWSATSMIVLIKTPAIICDLICALLVYRMLEKKFERGGVLALVTLILFNPATIINSSAWGQVDSVFCIFVILFIACLYEKKLILSCIFFTIGFLIKPQTAIYAPIILMYFAYHIIKDEDKKPIIKETLISAGVCIAGAFVLMIPFAKNFNFMPIIEQYVETFASYQYGSVNAFNLFYLLGGNWKGLETPFIFTTYGVWSNIFIVALVCYAVWCFIRKKGELDYFLIASFIITAMFTLAAKMHERYVYPAILLLLCAFVRTLDTRLLKSFAAISVTQFINAGLVLYEDMANNSTNVVLSVLTGLVAIVNIVIFVYIAYIMFTGTKTADELKVISDKKKAEKKALKNRPFSLQVSDKPLKLTKLDAIIMTAVTLIYAITAFTNLGDMKAPETMWKSDMAGQGFVVEFEGSPYIQDIKWFNGPYHNKKLDVEGMSEQIDLGSVFRWEKKTLGYNVDKLTFTAPEADTYIAEIVFVDNLGNTVSPSNVTYIGKNGGVDSLFDEQEMVPAVSSYKNSTYFDEIYHARTAYEFVHSLPVYEWTHPPLGKVFIALGVMLFGMNPFGWRCVGTLFGVLMLPALYIFAKKMFKSTRIAAFAIMLFALDFMHFTQTRIATIDVYITFFIILMYYFMYSYSQMSFFDTPFKKTLVPLALSGVSMGLGIACKWTGVYAGAGLALIFFWTLGRRFYEAKRLKRFAGATKEQREAVKNVNRYATLTILWCILFFVIVPIIIYLLSYFMYLRAPGSQGLKTIWDNQMGMFNYHSGLNATHSFSSMWYEWPIMRKPIWYFSGTNEAGLDMSISSFGNPIIWWSGIAAILYCFYKALIYRDKKAAFLSVGMLAQYVPWMGVTRIAFIYHYFTVTPFMILMLAYAACDMYEKYPHNGLCIKNNRTTVLVCVFVLVALILFIAFYPVLSGAPVSSAYIDTRLRWFGTWFF